MSKNIAIDGNLAAQVRRLVGARSAREAAETVLREYVLQNEREIRADENNGTGKSREESQFERIRKSAMDIAQHGDPFYPGFNPKKLWNPRDFG